MNVTTKPCCKVGWEGQTLHYVVQAEGADEIVAVENGFDCLDVRVVNTRTTASGVEADLEVKVLNSELF